MPWYRTGTVAVTLNSNTVTGTGTSFVANCRVGDAFLGPDGGWYEVTNVVSNTVLSISPNYRGATNAAGGYSLTPVQGYTKDLADQARAMIQQWGSTLAGLGSVSTENVVPVTKGGTGSTTAAGAGAALGLKTGAYADLVGIVTSGAIFETGTNANGTYIRFADGTQICFGLVTRTCAVTNVTGSLFYGYAATITFPSAFIAAPTFTCQSYSSGVLTWDGNGGSTTSLGVPMMLSSASVASRNFSCNYLAIGKWK